MMEHLHLVIGTLVGMDTASVLSLQCFAEVIEVTRGARWLEVLSAASDPVSVLPMSPSSWRAMQADSILLPQVLGIWVCPTGFIDECQWLVWPNFSGRERCGKPICASLLHRATPRWRSLGVTWSMWSWRKLLNSSWKFKKCIECSIAIRSSCVFWTTKRELTLQSLGPTNAFQELQEKNLAVHVPSGRGWNNDKIWMKYV